ncbi:hypothetical protein A6F68_00126 [Tsuneonella dongtanensis]|uniref:Membrane-bound lysozyme-inhibitor of c-type lysozyme n=1 Tax=Tsuneonella dongtanensis TaxID=692370 RepID=A0A1B2A952_9SPHN|nr:hypothetical protein [Tsuneonella dongtanensis]ANY18662.1 hypothetical protein A6F68_00126 [Tsuneonella dongtanensis]
MRKTILAAVAFSILLAGCDQATNEERNELRPTAKASALDGEAMSLKFVCNGSPGTFEMVLKNDPIRSKDLPFKVGSVEYLTPSPWGDEGKGWVAEFDDHFVVNDQLFWKDAEAGRKIVWLSPESGDAIECNPANQPETAATDAPSVGSMIDDWREYNGRCRGGSGDDAETWAACEKRDALGQSLKKANWCYGEKDQWAGDADWHRCSGTSL